MEKFQNYGQFLKAQKQKNAVKTIDASQCFYRIYL